MNSRQYVHHFFNLETYTFEVISTKKNWPEAYAHCKTLNGDLASFLSADEVAGLAISSSEWYWIGLERDKDEYGEWVWSDGASTTWLDWAPGQPNKANSCGQLKGDGKLYDWSCDGNGITFPFICKVPGKDLPVPYYAFKTYSGTSQ